MGGVRVKIRGIYATALTGLLLERGFEIVSPSEMIRDRFGLPDDPGPEEVLIVDHRDRQGVSIEGVRGATEEVVAALREALPYALFVPQGLPRPRGPGGPLAALLAAKARFLAEFPRPVKEALDGIRARYVPTIPGHHHLKVIDPARVDEAEAGAAPEDLPGRAAELLEALVYRHFRPGKEVEVRHGKAGDGFFWRGTVARFVPGEVLVLERRFRAGGRTIRWRSPRRRGITGRWSSTRGGGGGRGRTSAPTGPP